jgi:ABC-type transport system substrate-binding protein
MQVGDDGFKKHPIGAGPYKFVGSKPGIEVELEAFTGYWRRAERQDVGDEERARCHHAR